MYRRRASNASGHYVDGDGGDKSPSVRKVTIERRNPDPGAEGDLTECGVGAGFDKDVAGSVEEQATVSLGIGSHSGTHLAGRPETIGR
jgi:hypothetical protein